MQKGGLVNLVLTEPIGYLRKRRKQCINYLTSLGKRFVEQPLSVVTKKNHREATSRIKEILLVCAWWNLGRNSITHPFPAG